METVKKFGSLKFIQNDICRKTFFLKKGICTFGQSSVATIRINSDNPMDIYCEIYVDDNGVARFTNNLPKLSIFLNGKSVHGPVVLKNGDLIKIFDKNIKYENENLSANLIVPEKIPKTRKADRASFMVSTSSNLKMRSPATKPLDSSETRQSVRIKTANSSFREADASLAEPSKATMTPRHKNNFVISSPTSAVKPTNLRNKVLLKSLSNKPGNSPISRRSSKRRSTLQETSMPNIPEDESTCSVIEDQEKMNVDGKVNLSSSDLISFTSFSDSPGRRLTRSQSNISDIQELSNSLLNTPKNKSIAEKRSIVRTPKSAIKATTLESEATTSTPEKDFTTVPNSTNASNFTVESLYESTVDDFNQTPPTSHTKKSLKKSSVTFDNKESINIITPSPRATTEEELVHTPETSSLLPLTFNESITKIRKSARKLRQSQANLSGEFIINNSSPILNEESSPVASKTRITFSEDTAKGSPDIPSSRKVIKTPRISRSANKSRHSLVFDEIDEIGMEFNDEEENPKGKIPEQNNPNKRHRRSSFDDSIKLSSKRIKRGNYSPNNKENTSLFNNCSTTSEGSYLLHDEIPNFNRSLKTSATEPRNLKRTSLRRSLPSTKLQFPSETSIDMCGDSTLETVNSSSFVYISPSKASNLEGNSKFYEDDTHEKPNQENALNGETLTKSDDLEKVFSRETRSNNASTLDKSVNANEGNKISENTEVMEYSLISDSSEESDELQDSSTKSNELPISKSYLSSTNLNLSKVNDSERYEALEKTSAKKCDNVSQNTSALNKSTNPKDITTTEETNFKDSIINEASIKDVEGIHRRTRSSIFNASTSLTNKSTNLAPYDVPETVDSILSADISIDFLESDADLINTSDDASQNVNNLECSEAKEIDEEVVLEESFNKRGNRSSMTRTANNLLNKSTNLIASEVHEVPDTEKNISEASTNKKLLKTPKQQKEPLNDLTSPRGVKQLMKTPKPQKEPLNDLTSPRGVKQLLKTPKPQKEPFNDLTSPKGVKKLLKTPKLQKEPLNDLNSPRGVKQLLKTPKLQKEPLNDLTSPKGVKQLLKTPKPQKDPLNDLTSPKGVKKLLKTPKLQKEPLNDLTSPRGVKQLLKTPKPQKEPLNDLTSPKGVKKLLKTPKLQKEPLNDLSSPRGMKQLLKTPKPQKEPLNDLTSPKGVKQLLKTPKHQKEPLNDLTSPKGLDDLFNTSGENDLNMSGVNLLDDMDLFPKKQEFKTYRGKSVSPIKPAQLYKSRKTLGIPANESPDVNKWKNETNLSKPEMQEVGAENKEPDTSKRSNKRKSINSRGSENKKNIKINSNSKSLEESSEDEGNTKSKRAKKNVNNKVENKEIEMDEVLVEENIVKKSRGRKRAVKVLASSDEAENKNDDIPVLVPCVDEEPLPPLAKTKRKVSLKEEVSKEIEVDEVSAEENVVKKSRGRKRAVKVVSSSDETDNINNDVAAVVPCADKDSVEKDIVKKGKGKKRAVKVVASLDKAENLNDIPGEDEESSPSPAKTKRKVPLSEEISNNIEKPSTRSRRNKRVASEDLIGEKENTNKRANTRSKRVVENMNNTVENKEIEIDEVKKDIVKGKRGRKRAVKVVASSDTAENKNNDISVVESNEDAEPSPQTAKSKTKVALKEDISVDITEKPSTRSKRNKRGASEDLIGEKESTNKRANSRSKRIEENVNNNVENKEIKIDEDCVEKGTVKRGRRGAVKVVANLDNAENKNDDIPVVVLYADEEPSPPPARTKRKVVLKPKISNEIIEKPSARSRKNKNAAHEDSIQENESTSKGTNTRSTRGKKNLDKKVVNKEIEVNEVSVEKDIVKEVRVTRSRRKLLSLEDMENQALDESANLSNVGSGRRAPSKRTRR